MSLSQRMSGERWVQVGGAAIAVAAAVLVWTGRRAWQLEEVAPRSGAVALSQDALLSVTGESALDVRRAVAADLFTPDRSAPPARYRLPGESAPVAVSAAPAPSLPIVLGTAIAGGGMSFATCQFESSRLLMVRVGDRVGPYLVKSIERGRVVFQTPTGERLEILALRPGS